MPVGNRQHGVSDGDRGNVTVNTDQARRTKRSRRLRRDAEALRYWLGTRLHRRTVPRRPRSWRERPGRGRPAARPPVKMKRAEGNRPGRTERRFLNRDTQTHCSTSRPTSKSEVLRRVRGPHGGLQGDHRQPGSDKPLKFVRASPAHLPGRPPGVRTSRDVPERPGRPNPALGVAAGIRIAARNPGAYGQEVRPFACRGTAHGGTAPWVDGADDRKEARRKKAKTTLPAGYVRRSHTRA